MYCKKCGGKLESYASNCAFCGTPVEKYDTSVNYIKEDRVKEKGTMTVGKWIGLTFLPAIPLVGALIYLVLMFKWGFGENDDRTLKSYARANLLLMLLAFILFAALVVWVMMMPEFFEQFMAEV